jgi:hypothetical protein
MPFSKGESGNPAGRPIGSRNRKALLMEQLLEGDGEGLARRVIEKAMQGDTPALNACLDRLLPRGRDRPVLFPLPDIKTPEDAVRALAEINAGVGSAALTSREGMDLLRFVEKMLQVLVTARGLQTARMPGDTVTHIYRRQTAEEAQAAEKAMSK